jgi:aryl carrier-like protein
MESYCSLCTFKVPQGANNLILCTLDTVHILFFAARLIINQINKVQWVDFKLENVLVSLHSLKTMGLLHYFLRNGELLGHSPIRNVL